MGLLKEILLAPAAPIRGVLWVGEQVQDAAEAEYYDPATIRYQLEQVEEQRQAGLLDDDEAEAWEDELLMRLAEGQRRLGRREGI